MPSRSALPVHLLLLPALAALHLPALARDLSGEWDLRAELGQRTGQVQLTLSRQGADTYEVRRTLRLGEAQATSAGEAVLRQGRLEVRLRPSPGLAGAVLEREGEAYGGTYDVSGETLTGTIRAPLPSGQVASWREVGARRRAEAEARSAGRLRVVGRQFVDPSGRVVLLRGVNAGLKRAPFLPPQSEADVRRLVEATGINFVRFYVAWRALEPEPLRYDPAYLDAVVEGVRRWTRAGVYVCVDMHQDVWGGRFTPHGAPEWASLGDAGGTMLPPGLPWQARYAEPQVYEQFEALWADRRVPATGLGLQEHYARAWAALAARLRDEELVVGYDLINEPFLGAEMEEVFDLALAAAVGVATRGARPAGGDLPGALAGLVSRLRDPAGFEAALSLFAPAAARMEQRLSRFYARVGRAIRAVDPGRPLFLEPFALAGVGAPSALPHPGLDGIVYAPHLYDAFMDAGLSYDGDLRRVERAFARHLATAARLGAPLVIGEWGNLSDAAGGDRMAHDVVRLLDRHGVGAAYWEHIPGGGNVPWGEVGNGEPAHTDRLKVCHEDHPFLRAALAPYAPAIAGDPVGSAWDPVTRTLTVELRGPRPGAPTVLATPLGSFPAGVEVRLSGAASRSVHDPQQGQVRVWAQGEGSLRIEVRARRP